MKGEKNGGDKFIMLIPDIVNIVRLLLGYTENWTYAMHLHVRYILTSGLKIGIDSSFTREQD